MAKAKKTIPPKKRATKYEDKLAVNLSFEELMKLSLSPSPAPSKSGTPPKKGKK